MKTLPLKYLLIVSACVFPFFAYADNPSIASYKASESLINSGQAVTFSWTLNNAGGYSFTIPCSSGIIIKKENGSSFDCNTSISTTQVTNDAIILILYNVSGSTKSIVTRLTPKTTAGMDYTAGLQEMSISINTVAKPISSFTASPIDTSTGQPVTVSWSSQVLGGVNLQIDCSSDIRVSSPSYAAAGFLPCGKIIFAHDLSPSGSLTLLFANSNSLPVPYTIKLYPATVADTSYDGAHAVTLTLNVASDIIPDPVITYFTASTTAVDSGGSVKLSWGSDHAVGVNMKISCNQTITATSTQRSDQQFPCNDYMFNPFLGTAGQLNVVFINTSSQDQTIMLTAIAAKQGGLYDALRGKSFSLIIHPAALPIASISPSPSPSASPIPSPMPSMLSSPASKTIFTQFLRRGSHGAQVSALQEFLKRDRTLYPEGIVIGFFGPATERAVQRFQVKYGIAAGGTPGTTGYGALGPKTRSKLNTLQ